MSTQPRWKILFAVVIVLFFANLWWGCWFLRAGPDGSRGWAFFPIIAQGVALAFAAIQVGFKAFDKEDHL